MDGRNVWYLEHFVTVDRVGAACLDCRRVRQEQHELFATFLAQSCNVKAINGGPFNFRSHFHKALQKLLLHEIEFEKWGTLSYSV